MNKIDSSQEIFINNKIRQESNIKKNEEILILNKDNLDNKYINIESTSNKCESTNNESIS